MNNQYKEVYSPSILLLFTGAQPRTHGYFASVIGVRSEMGDFSQRWAK
jgi:hypothetical protein